MKRLPPLCLLLWLTACAVANTANRAEPYTPFAPSLYYAASTTWILNDHWMGRDKLAPGDTVTAIGSWRRWYVVRYAGQLFLVDETALEPETFAPHVLTGRTVYPPADAPPAAATSTATGGLYYALPHDTYIGPRGGEYYYNGYGNKQYVTPPATLYSQPVQTGPRGGQYYINDNGRKAYIKH